MFKKAIFFLDILGYLRMLLEGLRVFLATLFNSALCLRC